MGEFEITRSRKYEWLDIMNVSSAIFPFFSNLLFIGNRIQVEWQFEIK